MRRLAVAALLLLSSLGYVACAHDHALDRHDVARMQNDSPAISPWSTPIPSDPVEQRSSARGPDDEN
jgi:hypothetical protein